MIRTREHDVVREVRLQLVMLLSVSRTQERISSFLETCSIYVKIFHIISTYRKGIFNKRLRTDCLQHRYIVDAGVLNVKCALHQL